MKKIWQIILIIIIMIFTLNIICAEKTECLIVAKVQYGEIADPYAFSDEPLMDEETAKLEQEREAYEKLNTLEKAVYNKRYIIFGIFIGLIIVITGTIIFVKLNKKRWK